ncbi:MAG: 50S ribosomal protein L11 methyltransferase [Bacteroidota bacterium]
MYQTEKEHLKIAGMEIDLLRIVNVDELYSNLVSKGDDHEDVKDERIPYWADLWPSAIGLSEHLVQSKIITKDSIVHEMGCGLGLPGIVAGKLGAKVSFSDYLDEALDFARQNWNLNNMASADFQKLDWRNPNTGLKADLLLASDVAYERKAFEFLPHAFKTLSKSGGKIIVSEPNRLYAQEFFDSLSFHGFTMKKFIYSVHRNNHQHRVNVFEIESH